MIVMVTEENKQQYTRSLVAAREPLRLRALRNEVLRYTVSTVCTLCLDRATTSSESGIENLLLGTSWTTMEVLVYFVRQSVVDWYPL